MFVSKACIYYYGLHSYIYSLFSAFSRRVTRVDSRVRVTRAHEISKISISQRAQSIRAHAHESLIIEVATRDLEWTIDIHGSRLRVLTFLRRMTTLER